MKIAGGNEDPRHPGSSPVEFFADAYAGMHPPPQGRDPVVDREQRQRIHRIAPLVESLLSR